MRTFTITFCLFFISFGIFTQGYINLDQLPTNQVAQGLANPPVIPTSGAMFYTDEMMFTNDCGPIFTEFIEDFEDGMDEGFGFGFGPFPLNADSDDGAFSPGNIVNNLELTHIDNEPSLPDDYALIFPVNVTYNVPDNSVGSQWFADHTTINIVNPGNTNYVKFNFVDPVFPNDEYVIEAFTSGDISLGQMNVFANGSTPVFVGIIGANPIAKVEIRGLGSEGGAELLTDVTFGFCGEIIPTLSQWGIIALSLLSMIIGVVALRRRRTVLV